MPLFDVTVREHAYTGRFYHDVVPAESCEEALQVAAEQATMPRPPPGPRPRQDLDVAVREQAYTGRLSTDVVQAAARPPPGPRPRRGFDVAVREQAYTGRLYTDVVSAESCEEALQVAAEQAAAPRALPRPKPQPDAAGRPRCADVWVYSLLHCELVAGHDPPHMAVARGYRRPVRWVRDDRGVAHALPEPDAAPPAVPSITQPPPAPEGESPQAPLTGGDG
jgi:hypothetical protein